MTNILSIITIVAIVTAAFTGLGFVFTDIANNNEILNEESNKIMKDIKNETNINLEITNLDIQQSNLTANSTFEGTDDFSRQYREERAQVTQLTTNVDTIKKVPGIFIKSFGIPLTSQVIMYLSIIGSVLSIVILLALYIAIKTGEVKNR